MEVLDMWREKGARRREHTVGLGGWGGVNLWDSGRLGLTSTKGLTIPISGILGSASK